MSLKRKVTVPDGNGASPGLAEAISTADYSAALGGVPSRRRLFRMTAARMHVSLCKSLLEVRDEILRVL